MRRHISSKLFAALSTAVGPTDAALEIKWMQDTLRSRVQGAPLTTVPDMIRRRIKGEPLQYVLGNLSSKILPSTHKDVFVNNLQGRNRSVLLICWYDLPH